MLKNSFKCMSYKTIFHSLFASWVILSSAVVFFRNYLFQKTLFMNIIRVSNSSDTDQARWTVGPNLGPNCAVDKT